jgi:hypothetical protein
MVLGRRIGNEANWEPTVPGTSQSELLGYKKRGKKERCDSVPHCWEFAMRWLGKGLINRLLQLVRSGTLIGGAWECWDAQAPWRQGVEG